jgi:hypothetical protein
MFSTPWSESFNSFFKKGGVPRIGMGANLKECNSSNPWRWWQTPRGCKHRFNASHVGLYEFSGDFMYKDSWIVIIIAIDKIQCVIF